SSDIKEDNPISLKQAFSLYSKLVHVKKIHAGQSISYGQTYKADKDEWIGTVPIGDGDDRLRKLQGYHVLIDGEYLPIGGRRCIDMMVIRLNKRYDVGTSVVIRREQNYNRITMDAVAEHLATIKYEIPCRINERIPRLSTSAK